MRKVVKIYKKFSRYEIFTFVVVVLYAFNVILGIGSFDFVCANFCFDGLVEFLSFCLILFGLSKRSEQSKSLRGVR